MNDTVTTKNSDWKIQVICKRNEIDEIGAALEELAVAVAAFEIIPNGDWRLEAYTTEPPVTEIIAHALGHRAFQLIELPPTDWLAENRRHFPPQGLGRFFIYGSYYDGKLPPSRKALLIEAATAFGTGEHATTRLCLRAITEMVKQHRPKIALDIGTGSGILSLALSHLAPTQIFASDIDENAVTVTRENARINQVARQMTIVKANGLHHPKLIAMRRGKTWHGRTKFPLIIANILAGPLCKIARDVAAATDAGGIIILSGILITQEAQVIAAYRQHHISLLYRRHMDGWSCLVMRTRGRHGLQRSVDVSDFTRNYLRLLRRC